MSNEILPVEVKNLLLGPIASVTHLEALLFFHAHPEEAWDPQSLAKRLYASDSEMVAALCDLGSDGFLATKDGRYSYAARTEDQAKIDALADAYAHQLIAVTNLIHDRRRNIQAFSDAFRLRRER